MFSLARFTALIVVALAVGFAQPAVAQLARPFAGEAMIGGGNGGGGEFFDNGFAAARLALSARAPQHERVAVFAEAGYDWLGLGMGHKTVCVPSSRGGCELPYPDIAGPSGTVGILVAPSTRLEARLGFGGAAYSVDGTRLGAVVGQLDAALFPTARLGLVFGGRVVVIPSYRHDRLFTIPVLVGLRVR